MPTAKRDATNLGASSSTTAVGFAAAVLATALSLVYVVAQLAEWMGWLGSSGGAQGRLEGIEPFVFVPFDSFLYAVDILGYSFMSMATLFMAGVFRGDGIERTARWFLIANGTLLPFLALQMYWHSLIWGGALWAITFPGATWTLAIIFRRADVRMQQPPARTTTRAQVNADVGARAGTGS